MTWVLLEVIWGSGWVQREWHALGQYATFLCGAPRPHVLGLEDNTRRVLHEVSFEDAKGQVPPTYRLCYTCRVKSDRLYTRR